MSHPTDMRIFAIAQALEEGYSIDRITELTKIDKWFVERLDNIVRYAKVLSGIYKIEDLDRDTMQEAKRPRILRFPDSSPRRESRGRDGG